MCVCVRACTRAQVGGGAGSRVGSAGKRVVQRQLSNNKNKHNHQTVSARPAGKGFPHRVILTKALCAMCSYHLTAEETEAQVCLARRLGLALIPVYLGCHSWPLTTPPSAHPPPPRPCSTGAVISSVSPGEPSSYINRRSAHLFSSPAIHSLVINKCVQRFHQCTKFGRV